MHSWFVMGQTQTVFLPPWVPTTESEKQRKQEFTAAIRRIGHTAANLVSPHPLVEHPDFVFDWVEHRPFAEAAYREDPRLFKLLPNLVPKRCARPLHRDASPEMSSEARETVAPSCVFLRLFLRLCSTARARVLQSV